MPVTRLFLDMTLQHAAVLTLFTLFAVHVCALQAAPGTACTGVGSACTGTFDGFCAPDLFCGDNGAICTTDDDCYDFCGSDGICGGLGALCGSTDPFVRGQQELTCDTPAYTCKFTAGMGACTLTASAAMRRRSKEQLPFGPTDCRRQSDKLCVRNGRAECIDITSDFGNCGDCRFDCGETLGADTVECVEGVCLVARCRRGWTQLGNECLRA
ncbi:hypothetical protein CALCODRAFT_91104 [Calocera cornea HHB12733]|uniref:Protein CPL1-like domain-containing protein n=1 Tax=Calocera cornea HHB12733 TaxID=1353952 RepID=A0A165DAQ2_9BASI|nr:hypothetical protein CALCODRAFT_91104 [Calocera cornea HHB12733]